MTVSAGNLDNEYKSAIIQGKKHKQNKEYDKALECFESALAIRSDNPELWFDIGYVQLSLKKHEQAIVSFDQSIRINSDNPMAWYYKGTVLVDLNKYDEALSCFDKSIERANAEVDYKFHRSLPIGLSTTPNYPISLLRGHFLYYCTAPKCRC